MGFMRAGAAIFSEGAIDQVNCYIFTPLAGRTTTLQAIAALHAEYNGDIRRARGDDWQTLFKCQFVSDLTGRAGHIDVFGPGARLRWLTDDGKGLYIAEGCRASAYTGHAALLNKASDGRISISEPEFLAMTVTSLDAKPGQALEHSENILITACGRCENTGMKFSKDRRTVGRNWGGPPVRIEAAEGTIVVPKGRWICHALGPDGLPTCEVPVLHQDGQGILKLSPQYKTMWYLLTRSTK